MTKDRLIKYQYLLAIMDVCSIIVAFVLAYYLRFYSHLFALEGTSFYPIEKYLVLMVYLVPIFLFTYFVSRLYKRMAKARSWKWVLSFLISNVVGMVLFLSLLFLQKENNISRKFLLLFLIINIVLGIGSKILITYAAKLKLNRK